MYRIPIMPVIKCVGKLSPLNIGALTVAALCLGLLTGRLIPRLAGVYAQVPETPPYTLIFNQRLEPPGKLPQTTKVLAVRGDGSTAHISRTEWTGPAHAVPGGVFESRDIVDLVSKRQVSIWPFAKATTTVPIGDAEVEKMRTSLGPRQDCPGDARFKRNEQTDTVMLGYAAEHYVYEAVESGDSVREEEWRAPQLGCVALKRTLTVTTPGVSTSGSTVEIQDIIPGDPPAKYFAVPEDYKEYAPSEVYKALLKAEGRECQPCEANVGPRADANYYRQRGAVPPRQ